MAKAQSSYDILNDMADELEADFKRLQKIEEIVKASPEWLEQKPELKALVKLAA